jgi:hypothetical protein
MCDLITRLSVRVASLTFFRAVNSGTALKVLDVLNRTALHWRLYVVIALAAEAG